MNQIFSMFKSRGFWTTVVVAGVATWVFLKFVNPKLPAKLQV